MERESRGDDGGLDNLTISFDTERGTKTIDNAIREVGLDPAEWHVVRINLTKNKSSDTLRVMLSPRELVRPARIDGPKSQGFEPRYLNASKPSLWVILSDSQCPYHDERFHQLTCRWLNIHQPDGLIAAGDIFDFPTLSSYTPNPYMDTHANRSIDSGYLALRDWGDAAGFHARKIFIPGNHEQRLQKYLVRHSPSFVDMHRANEIEPLLSIPYLARLDELGYEYVVGLTGEWPQASYDIIPELTVMHGYLTRKGAGNTARLTAEHLGRSVIVGHIHSGAVVHFYHNKRLITGVENGTMARIEGGLGYAVEPGWSNCFTAVQIWPDGTYIIDLVTYKDERLVWGKEVIW